MGDFVTELAGERELVQTCLLGKETVTHIHLREV